MKIGMLSKTEWEQKKEFLKNNIHKLANNDLGVIEKVGITERSL
jgi:hypothetical protein